jgi:hypothetical protein
MNTLVARLTSTILLTCTVLLARPYPSMGQETEPKVEWNQIISAYDSFLDCPSPEYAKAMAGLFRKNGTPKIAGDEVQAIGYILSAENFGVLANEAVLGDKYSIEILFRLLDFTDGFGTEIVLGVLGTVVRIDPRLFLEVLFENSDIIYIKRIGLPISYPGYAYNNHPGAYRYDLGKRLDSLKSVNDPRLLSLRDECIKEIDKEIKDLKPAVVK